MVFLDSSLKSKYLFSFCTSQMRKAYQKFPTRDCRRVTVAAVTTRCTVAIPVLILQMIFYFKGTFSLCNILSSVTVIKLIHEKLPGFVLIRKLKVRDVMVWKVLVCILSVCHWKTPLPLAHMPEINISTSQTLRED